MILHCPECKAKYNLDTDKIPAASNKGITVTCPKCKHKFPLELEPRKPEEVKNNTSQEVIVPCPSCGHISISLKKCSGCGKVFTREDVEKLKITINS
jgi:predicted Zn finger-like uncharacterized protein